MVHPHRARTPPSAYAGRVRGRVWGLFAAAVGALVVTAVLIVLFQVHQATADWWPSAVPTRVQYEDRDFTCGNTHTEARPADIAGMVPRGRTIGGGVIYAPTGFLLPDGIAVRDGNTYYFCPLSGGS